MILLPFVMTTVTSPILTCVILECITYSCSAAFGKLKAEQEHLEIWLKKSECMHMRLDTNQNITQMVFTLLHC